MEDWGAESSAWGTSKADLVEQVKSFQRTSPAHKEAWYSFCKQQTGQSVFDPNRHDENVLMEFLVQANEGGVMDFSQVAGDSGASGDSPDGKAALVEEVKKFQRKGAAHKQAWDSFVMEKTGRSVFDPNRHDVDVLMEFVTNAEAGLIDLTAFGGEGDSGAWAASMANTDLPMEKAGLVEEVKNFQKTSQAHKEAWYKFCKEKTRGDKDPNRYDVDVLTEFVLKARAGEVTLAAPVGKGGRAGKAKGKGRDSWSEWESWSDGGQWSGNVGASGNLGAMMEMMKTMLSEVGGKGGKGAGRSKPYW